MASYFCHRRDLPDDEQCKKECDDCVRIEHEAYDEMQRQAERDYEIRRELYGDSWDPK